jgi:hypothetical protein
MAKASKCYTGSRQAVGVPTLNRNAYMQLFRTIRKEKERRMDSDKSLRKDGE